MEQNTVLTACVVVSPHLLAVPSAGILVPAPAPGGKQASKRTTPVVPCLENLLHNDAKWLEI